MNDPTVLKWIDELTAEQVGDLGATCEQIAMKCRSGRFGEDVNTRRAIPMVRAALRRLAKHGSTRRS